jgi:putative CRISPR-associated protein (TIGR02619 family)
VVRVLVISPVGTSLFRNFSRSPRFSGVAARYGVGSWGELPIDDPRNAYPGGEVCGYLREEPLIEALLEFAGSDPRASCAELAGTLAALDEARSRYGRVEAEALLYPTATCTSYLASEVVARYLRSAGVPAEVRVVEAIRSAEDFDEGLASLVDVAVGDVVEYSRRGYRVYVNATPGFKAEASFLVLASILAGARAVYYIHETFRRPVKLPAVPLSVDSRYLELLRRVAEGGGLELAQAYGLLGLTEADVKDLEDRYLAYVDGTVLKPRRWVVKLLEKLGTRPTV